MSFWIGCQQLKADCEQRFAYNNFYMCSALFEVLVEDVNFGSSTHGLTLALLAPFGGREGRTKKCKFSDHEVNFFSFLSHYNELYEVS